jgi:hypothetical protein
VQIGSENRKQVIIASVLGAIALVQVVRMMWPSAPETPVAASSTTAAFSASSSTTSSSSASSTSGHTNRVVVAKVGSKAIADDASSLDPTLRLALLHSVEGISYNGSGRNIFVEQQEVEIPQVAKKVDTTPPPPTGPPPPPAITLKFFGFANRAGEAKKVFLSEGDDVFIAAEGDIVNRRYKVVHITPNAVEIEDVLYNHSQSIPLTQS